MDLSSRLVLLLLLACGVSCQNASNCNALSPECLHQCLSQSYETAGNHPFKDALMRHGKTYEIVGLSKDCIFFSFFWTGTVATTAKIPSFTKFNGTGHCANKRVMMVRTTGEDRKIMLMVDAFGRRVRVQSVYEGKTEFIDDVLFVQVDAMNRHLHAYSQQVPRGFTIETIFNANYHVYVIARNHYGFRIFELMVELDAQLNVIPYLREESIDINPVLQAPFGSPSVTVFHTLDLTSDFFDRMPNEKINKNCGISRAVKLLEDGNYFKEAVVKGMIDSRLSMHADERTVVSKFVADIAKAVTSKGLHQKARDDLAKKCSLVNDRTRVDAWGLSMWTSTSTSPFALPFISILGHTSRGVSRQAGREAPNLFYQEKSGRFLLNKHPCMDELSHLMVYTYQLAESVSNDYKGSSPNRYAYTTKRFFNENNYNRRMARPHTIARIKNDQKIRGGFLLLLPAAIVFAILGCLYGIYPTIKGVQRFFRRRKGLRNTTSTANSN